MLRNGFLFGSSFLLLSTLVANACSNVAGDCHETSSCGASAGTPTGGSQPTAGAAEGGSSSGKGGSSSGASGNAGSTSGSSNNSGGAGTGSGGEGGGEAGVGGMPVVLPCGGNCPSDKPVCKEATDTCVQCLLPSDCTTGSKPKCDTVSNSCVQCLASTDCSDAKSAKCDGGACTKCTSNDDCAHISGKTICDTKAGECVQCTGKDASACGNDMGTPLVCDTLARTCTTKKERSAGLCQPCVSDQQCKLGELCVKETFSAPAKDVGYFCFWQKGSADGGAPALCSAARPYVKTLVNQTSIDGSAGDICGLAVSTCTARNQFRSKDCTTSTTADDSKCGFESGVDSKCGQFDVGTYRCTMACLSDDDCPVGAGCDTGASPPVCQL